MVVFNKEMKRACLNELERGEELGEVKNIS